MSAKFFLFGFNAVRQPKLGRRNSRSGQIYVRNELEICMKIYNRGNAKYYYIDKVFSLIFSPERTIATLSLLSQLNIKIDSGLELSLVEGLVWLPSPSPSPFSVALTMLSVSSLRAGQHPSSTICTDTFFMRWFSYLFLQHGKSFALPRMLTNSIINEILDMF